MWRRPSYWLVMAVLSFLLGWIALVMTDLLLAQQTNTGPLASMSLANQLITPFFSVVSLVSLVLVALLAGQLLSAERAQGTLVCLLHSGLGDMRVMAHKFLALLLLVVPLLVPVAVALWGWSGAAALNWPVVGWNFLAWLLLLLWFSALSVWLSINMSQPGLAALLGVLLLAVLWLAGQAGGGAEWGKNWLRVFSPRSHFEWIQHGIVPLSSLVFFVGGGVVLFGLAVMALKRLRVA